MARIHEDFFEKYGASSYDELLEIRDELFDEVRSFENNSELNNLDIDLEEPSADAIYNTNMLHLSEICRLITEKYGKTGRE